MSRAAPSITISFESREEATALCKLIQRALAAGPLTPLTEKVGAFTLDKMSDVTPRDPSTDAPPATELLSKAATHMHDRASTYDRPEGERSMGRAVAAFNAVTGRELIESEGWLLLQLLKDVRDRQRASPHKDSLEDCIAYAALKAEARLAGR